jgi:universal stress protein A
MALYKKILLAVELIPETDGEIIKVAQEITKQNDAHLYLTHAIEYLSSYGAAYGVAISPDLEEMQIKNANIAMEMLGDKINVPKNKRFVKMGPAKFSILDTADEIKADLIILGSHGRHGIRLLLGSTANAVIHSAKCDVLAVRLKEKK